jgi:hypothetical protein
MIIIGMLLLSSSQILLQDVGVSAASLEPDRDTRLTISGSYLIEDHQVWGSVLVYKGARLIIANGGHLETGSIVLSARSVMDVRSGRLTLENHTYTDRVGIFGECDRFIVTHNSVIRIKGPDGVYDVPSSKGADAGIDLLVEDAVRIEGSTIAITGGSGLSSTEPLTFDDLGDDEFAGGDALLRLEVSSNDLTTSLFIIKLSDISLTGGDGGDAPDGQSPPRPGVGGRGGGLTRGGDVSGFVASGGDATVNLSGRRIDIKGTSWTIDGGDGGDGGDGASVIPGDRAGGGGGGYSGGDGAHSDTPLAALPGGEVSGHAGSGGNVELSTTCESLNITGSALYMDAGNGGAAGAGGASHGKGGGGGGGYSGGGGGAHAAFDGASGGAVNGFVGRGGDATVGLPTEGWLIIEASGVFPTAGSGGVSGNGGNVTFTGGGGGGGCSGGGGGAQGSDDGTVDGTDGGHGGQVGGSVASGGDASIDLPSFFMAVLGSSLKAISGDGGDEGESGAYTGTVEMDVLGGTGGGGRSAGGGAGKGKASAEDGTPGTGEIVGPNIARGGHSRNWITADLPTISKDTAVVSRPGKGGQSIDHVPDHPLEGYSVSADGSGGNGAIHIPMSRPILLLPSHKSSAYELPMFTWVDVHWSTEEGNVTAYIVVVDTDEDFTSPDKLVEVPINSVAFKSLSFDVHYWYVRAVYSDGNRTFGPMSSISWFSFYNAPPRFHIIEPEAVYERQAATIDMSRHITDPDTPADNLTLFSNDERVMATDGLDMTVYFESPSDMEWISFSVSDGFSTKWYNIPIRVIDINDPPVIVSIGGQELPAVIKLKEGEMVWLEIVTEDRDNERLKYTLLTSWQDMRLDSDDRIRVWARPGMLGDRTAKLLVEDERGAITSTRISIRVSNTPDPPEKIEIFGPKDRSTHLQLDPITFTVKVTDPDIVWGDEVNVSWESDISGPLMTRTTGDVASFTTNSLPVGDHVITVTVDDGYHVEVTTMDIKVKERPPPPGAEEPREEGIPPLAILLLVIMPLLGYYLGRRGVGYARE